MNANRRHLAAGDIERFQLAAGFVHDSVVVSAGIANIPRGFVGQLAHGMGVRVVEE
jgi:hypothetical protein